MERASVRDLKQELLANVILPFSEAAHPAAVRADEVPALARKLAEGVSLAVSAAPVAGRLGIQRSIALGVSRRGLEYRLAVRVQRQALVHSPIVQHVVESARGEADVRFIGRVDKRKKIQVFSVPGSSPWYRQNVRPLLIGSSVGHVAITAGTLGGFVRCDGRLCVLSNNHVLANEDAASEGDPVIQRARNDGGLDPADRIGRLYRAVPLASGSNEVDAAVAVLDEPPAEPDQLRGIVSGKDRRLAGVGPAFLDEGDIVYKLGRTTGATRGRVTAFDLDNVVVTFDRGNLRFHGQVEIEGADATSFSDGGDSGALIVNEDMEAVALLFAGGEIGGTNGLGLTYANPIQTVLSATGAELVF